MGKISYHYLIEELGLTPEQIREIVHEAQKLSGKTLMMIDGALLENASLQRVSLKPFCPSKFSLS